MEISTEKEESYEVWLAEELKTMNVDEESYERVFMKVKGNLVSEKSYYGGGTWLMNRWYDPPVNWVESGKNNAYSET